MGVQKSNDLEADIEVDVLVEEEPKVTNEYVEVEEHRIFTLNADPVEERSQKCTVVLLHDQINDSNSWMEIKTLQTLSLYGYKAIAIDLPSHGRSSGPALHKAEKRSDFLEKFLEKLQLDNSKLVLLGTSMAGQYLIPFLNRLEENSNLLGLIGVGLSDCGELDLQIVMPKTLLIRGEMDTSIGLNASNALKNVENVRQFVMPAGKHLCHLGNPQLFNKVLINFLNSIQTH